MKAAVTNEQHGFDVIEVPDPEPGPAELVISVAACGVCGSDIKARPYMPAGMVMGHELGGEIVAVGRDTRDWRVGTNIAVLPVISCGSCASCADGVVAHCSQTRYIGMGPDRGGFAEFAVVPACHSFAMPDSLPKHYAALVEPFAVGLHGVHTAEISSGEDVLVIGAGGVGLTTTAWARAKGARRVTVADPDPQRRESATAMGATDTVASAEEAAPGAYDAVIECVGRPELLGASQAALRARGRVVVSGACDQPMPIEPITALLKEITIRFSVCYRPDEFRDTITAFADGAIDPTNMIGPTLGLNRIADAFDLVRSASVHGRVLVSPGAAK